MSVIDPEEERLFQQACDALSALEPPAFLALSVQAVTTVLSGAEDMQALRALLQTEREADEKEFRAYFTDLRDLLNTLLADN